MDGVTHWQSPRYFAYFASTASEAGILAELLAASLNQVGILWRTSPGAAGARGGDARLAPAAARPTGGLSRPHRGHRIRGDARRARGRPRRGSGQARRRRLRARALVGRQGRADPRARAAQGARRRRTSRCAPTCSSSTTRAPSWRRSARRRPRRSTRSTAIADALRGGRNLAARRRGLRGLGRRLRGAPAALRRLGARPTRSSSTRTSGSRRRWTAPRSGRRRVDAFRDAFSLVPEYLRVSEEVMSLNEVSVPLGRRFRALKLWFVLRSLGRQGLQAMIREHVRLAAEFERWVARGARLGGLRAAPLLARLLPARGRATRRTRRCSSASTRAARSSSRTRAWTAATCSGSRSGARARPKTTSASPGTCCDATRPTLRVLVRLRRRRARRRRERAEQLLDGGAVARDLRAVEIAVDEEVVEALGVGLEAASGSSSAPGRASPPTSERLLVADAEDEAAGALRRGVSRTCAGHLRASRAEMRPPAFGGPSVRTPQRAIA